MGTINCDPNLHDGVDGRRFHDEPGRREQVSSAIVSGTA